MRCPLRTRILSAVWLSAIAMQCHAEDLLSLYQHALNTNPVFKSYQYAVERADAQQQQAFSKLLPRLSVTGSYSQNAFRVESGATRGDTTHYPGTRATIQASQTLFDLPSYLRLQGAKSSVQQSLKQVDAGRMKLAGDLLDRYMKVLESEDQLVFIRSELEATAVQQRRLQAMYDRQLVKVTDVYEIEAYYKNLLTAEIDAVNTRSVGFEKLRELTGMEIQKVAPLARQDFPPLLRSSQEWVAEALRNNPNLHALQYAIESARNLISSSRAEHLPQLALMLSDSYADTGYDNRASTAYTVSSATIQLAMPIYSGGGVNAAVQEADARYRIVQQQLEELRRRIEVDTRTAYLNATTNFARMASTNQEVEFREKAHQAQQKSHERGVTTVIDVLYSQRQLFKARSEQARARYDYVRSILELRLQAGSFTEGDMEEINGWLAG